MMWAIKLRRTLIKYLKFIYKTRHSRRCLILGTPAHKNLGDHAIVYAQYMFLRDYDSNLPIMELSRLEYETYKLIVGLTAGKDTLIVVDGGGNLGTLWPGEDALIRDIVRRFPHNKTLIFPQTVYYDDSNEGVRLYDNSVRLFNSRDNLLLMLRDVRSYEYFQNKINETKLLLCPDIVTYIPNAVSAAYIERLGVGICLRDDKESVLDRSGLSIVEQQLKDRELSYHTITTISGVNIHEPERESVLHNTWRQFAGCRLVITDRLHGMIFSAITGTPCIAFNNISKKVSGGYRWLEQLGYIRVCEDISELGNTIDELMQVQVTGYDRGKVIKDYYKQVWDFLGKR